MRGADRGTARIRHGAAVDRGRGQIKGCFPGKIAHHGVVDGQIAAAHGVRRRPDGLGKRRMGLKRDNGNLICGDGEHFNRKIADIGADVVKGVAVLCQFVANPEILVVPSISGLAHGYENVEAIRVDYDFAAMARAKINRLRRDQQLPKFPRNRALSARRHATQEIGERKQRADFLDIDPRLRCGQWSRQCWIRGYHDNDLMCFEASWR